MTTPATSYEVRILTEAVAAIDLRGEVTAASEELLMDAYNRANESSPKTIILDFERLEYMNSGGIGLLVTLLVRAQRQHQSVLAHGLSEHYRQIFELTRLDEAMEIHPNESEALAAAGGS